ncbi:hypothetical protein PI125_g69 [Phytophthora idaei]|nr:hypothetical protein PI125_g69 [Phytophthora idaei]
MWADLSARLKEKGLRVLAKPGDTRWGSLLACFQTILAAEGILFSFVLAHRFLKAKTKKQKKTRRVVYDLATSTSFVSRLEKAVSLLKPINSKSFEKNTTPVSDVYQVFTELPAELNVVNLTAAEHKTVKTLIKSRFDFIYGDAHGLAYLLDPRYGGINMDNCVRVPWRCFWRSGMGKRRATLLLWSWQRIIATSVSSRPASHITGSFCASERFRCSTSGAG